VPTGTTSTERLTGISAATVSNPLGWAGFLFSQPLHEKQVAEPRVYFS